jgi:hypothetical protein
MFALSLLEDTLHIKRFGLLLTKGYKNMLQKEALEAINSNEISTTT